MCSCQCSIVKLKITKVPTIEDCLNKLWFTQLFFSLFQQPFNNQTLKIFNINSYVEPERRVGRRGLEGNTTKCKGQFSLTAEIMDDALLWARVQSPALPFTGYGISG